MRVTAPVLTQPGPAGLSWERSSGPPTGTGICLSGGGLRAATFALGVLQELQARAGLLYGPRCADHLAAVSGGSYVAAAHALTARRLAMKDDGAAAGAPPLAPDSPEEQAILDRGRYLVTPFWPTLGRFGLLWVLNVLALVVLFVWAGTMLADVAVLTEAFVGDEVVSRLWSPPAGLAVVVLVGSVLIAVRGLFSGAPLPRFALPAVGILGIAASALPAIRGTSDWPVFGTRARWALLLLAAVVALIVAAAVAHLLRRVGAVGLPAAAANWCGVLVVRAAGGVLLLWSAVEWYRFLGPGLMNPSGTVLVGFFASLFGGLVFSYVPDRASLHREYRDRIRSCFGVVRAGSEAVPEEPHLLLSQLGEERGPTPRLLVCATANVRTSRSRAFDSFVFSHDECGIPGSAAKFQTCRLELGRVPAGLLSGREPLVTVFTAVAATGAAASPSMGRYTVPSARPVLAALNLRVGRWLPNVTSARRRRAVATATEPGSFSRDARLGPGYNELVPEMLGISGPDMYVSDGGHYDNLGLVALLRARCAVIWCVDASPEPSGAAAELRRVLALAREELGVTADVDLTCFAAGDDGLYAATHAAGTVTYDDGQTARLFVVKLGLVAESPQKLKDYRDVDRGYPHHATRLQWYARRRMELYRDLGRDAAARALASPATASSEER